MLCMYMRRWNIKLLLVEEPSRCHLSVLVCKVAVLRSLVSTAIKTTNCNVNAT